MATWTDGPEYAPVERPGVFVEPDAAPLDAPAPEPRPEPAPAGAPAPSFQAVEAPPLEALAAPEPTRRDPQQPFDVASTPLTSWGEGPGPSADPTAPLMPVPVPAAPVALPYGAEPSFPDASPVPQVPQASAWGSAHAYPPPQTAPVPQAPPPPGAWPPPQQWTSQPPAVPTAPGIAQVVAAATPGVLICLALATFIAPLSIPLMMVASVLATRIRYRRLVLQRWFSTAVSLSFVAGLVTVFTSRRAFDVFWWWDAANSWGRLAAGALAVLVLVMVWDALRKQEPPEEPTVR